MTTITSPHNPRLKELRKLARASHRARTGLFAAEGEDLLAAAAKAGWQPVEGFRASSAHPGPGLTPPGIHAGPGLTPPGIHAGSGLTPPGAHPGSGLTPSGTHPGSGLTPPGAHADDASFHDVEPAALAAVSTLGSGTRAIAVYEQRWGTPLGPLCVYLHGVGDPGNVGSVLRGALAFGAASVVLGPGCADPYSPKAVRASMGAIFAVALARLSADGTPDGGGAPTTAALQALPGQKVALVAHAGKPISNLPAPPLTLLVGAEREGLPPEVIAACDEVAHIPISSESLNAAMAATVALYETTRRSTRVPAS